MTCKKKHRMLFVNNRSTILSWGRVTILLNGVRGGSEILKLSEGRATTSWPTLFLILVALPPPLNKDRSLTLNVNIQPPSCLRCTVLRKERLSSQGRQRGYNKRTFIVEVPRYLKEHVCGTYHPIHVIQLQKTACKCWYRGTSTHVDTLTHAHTKCPPGRSCSKLGNPGLVRDLNRLLALRGHVTIASLKQ